MRLYLAKGQYVGTQADARKIDKSFEQVEVPTDKEGLIAYLNGWCNVGVHDPLVIQSVLEEPAGAPAAAVFDKIMSSIDIEEQIASADFPTALRLAEHATSRVGECLREIADSRFPQPRKGYAA